jgi:2-phosphoglycolate phosphatase
VKADRAVLFDFDGTLADTAPDLAAAVNFLRVQRNLEPLPVDGLRPFASMGARGLLRAGLGLKPEDAEFPAMRDAFLAQYEKNICVCTRLFDGIPELLAKLSVPWGIVTNKATRFTGKLVPALGLKPACVVCGDSTPHLKPHPAPMLLAAQQLQLPCADILYVGDDLRDVQAARAAGMRSVAVAYGYHGVDNGGPETWNADILIHQPLDLLDHL